MVTLVPDTGRAYLSKFYDDNYMIDLGFLERTGQLPTVEEVLRLKRVEEPQIPALITIESHQKVGEAIDLMQRYSISQLPVVRNEPTESLADVIGSLQERGLLDRVFRNPDSLNEEVAAAMGPPLGAVDATESIDQVFTELSGAKRRGRGCPSGPADGDADAGGPARVPRAPSRRRPTVERRPYSEPGDLRAMQRLAEEVWRRDPAIAQETVGDLAWMTRQHAGREAEWRRQLWVDGGRVVAWGWIKPPARLFWEVDPRRPELLDEVFAWFEAEAAERPLEVAVRAGNRAAIAALERRGFAHDPEAPWIRHNARDLEHLDEPAVPPGYRLATMADAPDLAARVARPPERLPSVTRHRGELPPGHGGVAVPAGARLRRDRAGRVLFASLFALGWIDEATATGIARAVGHAFRAPAARARGRSQPATPYGGSAAAGARQGSRRQPGRRRLPRPEARCTNRSAFRELTRPPDDAYIAKPPSPS